jgi:hypothetical protein
VEWAFEMNLPELGIGLDHVRDALRRIKASYLDDVVPWQSLANLFLQPESGKSTSRVLKSGSAKY